MGQTLKSSNRVKDTLGIKNINRSTVVTNTYSPSGLVVARDLWEERMGSNS